MSAYLVYPLGLWLGSECFFKLRSGRGYAWVSRVCSARFGRGCRVMKP